ncbi:hypothetical protein [Neobacillus mesonae]|nr:hypothetical protein [Neobacillus mesonae]MCM3568209.1 hypothetical protein [Neobacillus mesonae]
MRNFDDYPKCIKKAVRYIKQDATKDQLIEISKLLEQAIQAKMERVTTVR